MSELPTFKWVSIPGGMLDQIVCECGWESKTYFDGDVYAHNEWKKHVVNDHMPKEISCSHWGLYAIDV